MPNLEFADIPGAIRKKLHDTSDLPALLHECINHGRALIVLDTSAKYELGELLAFLKRHKLYKHYSYGNEEKRTWRSFLAHAFRLERRTADNYTSAYSLILSFRQKRKQFPNFADFPFESLDPSLLLLVRRPVEEALAQGDEETALSWLHKAQTLDRATLKAEIKGASPPGKPREFLVINGSGRLVQAASWGEALTLAPDLAQAEKCIVIEHPQISYGRAYLESEESESGDSQVHDIEAQCIQDVPEPPENYKYVLKRMREVFEQLVGDIAHQEFSHAIDTLDRFGDLCSGLFDRLCQDSGQSEPP